MAQPQINFLPEPTPVVRRYKVISVDDHVTEPPHADADYRSKLQAAVDRPVVDAEAILEGGLLIGPRSYVKEHLAAYKGAGVTYLSVHPIDQHPVRTVELMRELVDEA